ncbi:hypothetical protein BDV93DRAFT_475292 [Ceratobasidium sp. AG-I]|nr:hypothetical protein BDV93DRAFT_475292 [Ceratobasidium sp. AG-I]
MASLAPASTTQPRTSAELDSQAPTLTPPTANSSPRQERATLPPSLPVDSEPTPTPTNPEDVSTSTPIPEPPLAAPTSSTPSPKPTDVAITFLLITGSRTTMHFAPTMTVGRVKEAFWSSWSPENTSEKPPAPSFLRVLHMGKILSDDQTLAAAKFPDVAASVSGTIVHISIRPFGPPADEDIVKAKRRSRRFLTSDSTSAAAGPPPTDAEAPHGGGCCGCIIC